MHIFLLNSKTDPVSKRVTSKLVDDVTLPTDQLTGNDLNTTTEISKYTVRDVKFVFLIRSQLKNCFEMFSLIMIKSNGIQ